MIERSGTVKYIPVENIVDGMRLARDVITPGGETLLLKELTLRAHFVYGLLAHQVTHVFVLDGEEQFSPDFQLLSSQTKYQAIDVAKMMFNSIKLGRLLNSQHITDFVGELVDELLSQTQLLVSLHRMGTVDEYLIEHSINTTIVSTVIGIRCGYPREKLLALAEGAFLHDIGKTKVPDAILNKPGPLTTAEFENVKMHTQYGFNIIRKMTDCTMQTAIVSLQHHEKYNGDGYPANLAQGQIHDFSRIVALADVYDSLTTDRCYRPGLPPDKALELMGKECGIHFDPFLYNIFANTVVVYPVGSFVELSDGSVGSVATLTADAYKPEVNLVIVNSDNGSVEHRRVNLLSEPNLTIRRSI
jgi:HD-GYP domain-containing protein (c-di-GMP phosphodiesterase class II)